MVIFLTFFRRRARYGNAVDIKCGVLSRRWQCSVEKNISLLSCSVSYFCNDEDDDVCDLMIKEY